jgi:uncharacterized membrane protein
VGQRSADLRLDRDQRLIGRARSAIIGRMSRLRFMVLPVGIALVAAVYWYLSREEAGTTMLLVFAGAIAVMGWILVPTVRDVGPTAPVDPDWEERRR